MMTRWERSDRRRPPTMTYGTPMAGNRWRQPLAAVLTGQGGGSNGSSNGSGSPVVRVMNPAERAMDEAIFLPACRPQAPSAAAALVAAPPLPAAAAGGGGGGGTRLWRAAWRSRRRSRAGYPRPLRARGGAGNDGAHGGGLVRGRGALRAAPPRGAAADAHVAVRRPRTSPRRRARRRRRSSGAAAAAPDEGAGAPASTGPAAAGARGGGAHLPGRAAARGAARLCVRRVLLGPRASPPPP